MVVMNGVKVRNCVCVLQLVVILMEVEVEVEESNKCSRVGEMHQLIVMDL